MAYEPMFNFLRANPNEGESQEVADMKTVSNERALVAGATPLLVGLLTGNTGDAAEIASKGLMAEDARAMKEQSSLMSYLRKREIASQKTGTTGSNRLYQVKNPDGSISYRTRADALNQTAPERRRSIDDTLTISGGKSNIRQTEHKLLGKHMKKLVDPVTKAETYIDITKAREGEPLSVKIEGDKTVHQAFRKEAASRYDKVNTRIKPELDILRNSESGLKLLKTKGQMPTKVALNMVVKLTEGRATDEDFLRVVEAVGYLNRTREAIQEEKDADVIKRKKAEAARVFKTLNNIARESLRGDIRKSVEAISETPEQLKHATKRFSDLMPTSVTDRGDQSDSSDITVDENLTRMSETDLSFMQKQEAKKSAARLKKIKELRKKLGK